MNGLNTTQYVSNKYNYATLYHCAMASLHFSSPSALMTQKTSLLLLKFADDTAVICLIRDNNESAAHGENAEQLTLQCSQNNLKMFRAMEMTVDLRKSPQRCFPSPPSTTLLPPLKSSGFWDPLAHRNKDELPKKTHHQEGTAEVQPTSTAANPLLQCNYLVCSVCIHHLLT